MRCCQCLGNDFLIVDSRFINQWNFFVFALYLVRVVDYYSGYCSGKQCGPIRSLDIFLLFFLEYHKINKCT